MRVSVALHRAEPRIGGNQRDIECAYRNYNRQYADLSDDGHCIVDIAFPPMDETFEHWVALYWSIGVCQDVPQDTGGGILNYAPLYEPMPVREGYVPKIKAVMKVANWQR